MIEEPPKDLELKPLPDNLEYVFLEEPSFLPVIISSQLSKEKKNKLISVLKKHKQAFAWKTTDIPGICPSFCKHKIQLLDDKKPVVQKQRRLNPNMQEVVKKEIMKLLDTGIIYPIADSPWVSPIHCVPKKGGITVVTNKNDELVPTRTVTGWRVCIDYRKLNEATAKDHFPLPFMDQMLERLAGNKYLCFLDGFSRYFQIPIDPNDQEKTTFTCPFGTYAYRLMPFGHYNAPATFQRCMLAIFHDMIEELVKVFMDDFSVFRNSFDTCLNNLDKMLQRCKDAHLVLNWEKCHFMVKEGIVLGQKVSNAGLEVDKAKNRYFSKIARPLTKLLEKDTPFKFDDECQKAFESLNEELTCGPVIVSPNWNLPFELMCDASDFAVGAVLGQKDGKNFHPIYFASKTLNPAQQKYTVTEKELMAVVFAFDKFRSYLILSKKFNIEIKDRKGIEYVAANHLSRIENDETSDDSEFDDNFPGETLMEINTKDKPWENLIDGISISSEMRPYGSTMLSIRTGKFSISSERKQFCHETWGELDADAITLLKRIRKFFMAQDIGECAAIHIFNRIRGLDVCVDLTGSSPLTQTGMVDFVPGRAMIDAAQRKRGKYIAKCAAIGYGFLPFSFSSLGELEADDVTLLKRIRKFSMA
ncbi:reverse transcriptase domain-containing protein [Tanacetum coccineum]